MPPTSTPAAGGSSTLPIIIIVVLFLAYRVYRRTKSQPVRYWRTILTTGVIVLISIVTVIATTYEARGVLVPVLVLALAGLVVGYLIGQLLMSSIHFWRDETTGQFWMRGGVAYVAVWLGAYLLRLGVRYEASGSLFSANYFQSPHPDSALSILASTLLCLSVGLWLARGIALIRKCRENARDTVKS